MNQAASRSLPFDIRQFGPVSVVTFHPDVCDRVQTERVNFELHGLIEGFDVPRLVLDFREVGSVTSGVLGVMMGVNLKICRKRGELRLCNLGAQVRETFALMKLDQILPIHGDVEDAVAGFQHV